ncbi:UDP-glycosyltransferase 74G1-like [Chenopodium quinoa]|uniref:Glycosyltransferase n=1 Tax=Chenopodium quinoa TaxID=63459 RepID=A0A803MFP3_CHEQI|nr:UDP-glycosyltransferase 74G1-like [Chenopodium quinoa]
MEVTKQAHKAHVLVFPFIGQGHVNPMLQFSKRLAFKGIKPTLITAQYIFKSMQTTTIETQFGPPIQIRSISDGYDDDSGGSHPESIAAYLDSLRVNGAKSLAQLIMRLNDEGDPVQAIIYDGFLPWALDVARQFGLVAGLFFTQSCTVNSIYYHVQRGLIQLPLTGPDLIKVSVPGAPELHPFEAPSFVHTYGSYPFWFDVILGQFSNIDQADWVLCNIFYDMEKEVVDWMAKLWKVRTIGPTVPSYYLDKRLEDDTDYGLHLLKPDKTLCKNWLDSKPKDSVVYVSFGSAAELSNEQFQELARGLKNSDLNFLWVVRESEQAKLPKGIIEENSKQGLVVGWASQLEVLAHEATGCFVTHCGFNSILEALSLGVPVVGVPQWTDQGTNAKFVEDIWGVGVRARVDDKGIVQRKQLEECITEVMEGEKSEEIKKNLSKWKKLAKEAVDVGGSSDKNIDEFVAYLAAC